MPFILFPFLRSLAVFPLTESYKMILFKAAITNWAAWEKLRRYLYNFIPVKLAFFSQAKATSWKCVGAQFKAITKKFDACMCVISLCFEIFLPELAN